MKDVVVTGVGAVTPLGVGADTLYERWAAGEIGIAGGEAPCANFDPLEYLLCLRGDVTPRVGGDAADIDGIVTYNHPADDRPPVGPVGDPIACDAHRVPPPSFPAPASRAPHVRQGRGRASCAGMLQSVARGEHGRDYRPCATAVHETCVEIS